MNSNIEHNCDVLVIGSGAAGLSLALCLASKAKVIVLSKSGLSAGSTNYAQGGIAGVFNTADDNDSVEEHIEDTKIAGGGLCDPDAVEFTLRNAHDSIEWLIKQGVPFDQKEEAVSEEQSPYHLHREGGHSHRRIFHAADHTGHTIQETLNTRVLENPNITLLDHHNAIDLITTRKLDLAGNRVVGAYVFNTETSKVETVKAKFVALCTGGASKVYQ
ncbi:MAG: FAD-dependent oxidoreductase, partial [Ruminobacter sp.]|nr:FAD-dependent oxidoreductase [Ruminobacter sp.]